MFWHFQALAGAAALLRSPDDATVARTAAIEVASQNRVAGQPVAFVPADISVDLNAGRVEVEVRGRALPFSLPVGGRTVVAHAKAEARAATFPPDLRRPPKVLRLVE